MATWGLLAERWRGAAGAMLVLAVFAWPASTQSQPSRPSEARVQLSWQPGWTSAGIAVEPGDTLSIRVRTIRRAADDRQQECERNPATGQIANCRQADRKEGTLPDTLLNFAARQVILGRLGEGKPFVVGRSFKKVMRAGGPLSLRWNVPREAARAAQGFNVTIRVEPGTNGDGGGDGRGDEGNLVLTNGVGTGGSSENSTDTNSGLPTNNVVEVLDNIVDDAPANAQDNVVEAGENIAAAVDPVLPGAPEERATEADANRNVSAADPETSLSMGQKAILGSLLAALLAALAAAAVGVQRWRRRRLINRTRAMLSLSPSLDLGEGACRGGGRPAEGPAASLRARLEEGAVHIAGGLKDG